MPPNGGPRIRLQPDTQPPDQYGEVNYPEEADIDYEIDMDEGDVCCEKARKAFLEYMMWAANAGNQEINPANAKQMEWMIEAIGEMPCEELYALLERNQSQRAKDILAIWDGCSTEKNSQMDFTASADPFEAAWDIMQKQIGREDFTYGMQIQPHLMSNQMGNMPAELGLRVGGQMPIRQAISHLQDSESIEDFARKKGWESAEDVGLRIEDFEDEDDFFEAQAEMGVGYPPEDHLEGEYRYFRPREAQDLALSPRGSLSDPEILRLNMEGFGHPNDTREAFPSVARDIMLDGLDNRLEAGAKLAPVSVGSISAMGQGPMIDVNPAFAGMGLGTSTLAALLENTGRLQEHYMSPGGLATLEGLGTKLDAAGIEHHLNIDPRARRPVMNEEQQMTNWQESEARYPHQGNVQMTIPQDTQLTHQGTPEHVDRVKHSVNQQIDGEPASTDEELKTMFDRAMRNSNQMRQKFPWHDRITWGED